MIEAVDQTTQVPRTTTEDIDRVPSTVQTSVATVLRTTSSDFVDASSQVNVVSTTKSVTTKTQVSRKHLTLGKFTATCEHITLSIPGLQ